MIKIKNKNQNQYQYEKESVTFDNFDKLKLKNFAENLFQIIDKSIASSITEVGKKTGYTMSLNADFGNGKTTFLKMFEHFIKTEKSDNYDVLFINAWESDFYSEPVIAILSEFVNWIEKATSTETSTEARQKIMNITKGIIGALGNTINQLIHNKIGIDTKKVMDSVNQSSEEFFTKKELISEGNHVLNNFEIRKKSIKQIKTSLLDFLNSSNKKLLIIVDELDRTRPDYAVHFLEDMKHFFNIENVSFLVAVNKKQMEATVKCLYGQALDFEGYYRKFFKQELNLPDPSKEAQTFVDSLIQKTQIKYNQETNDKQYRIKSSYLCCKMFKLTLREIEIFMNIFRLLVEHKNKIIKWSYMDAYSFFICLFLKEKECFQKVLNGNFTVKHFFEFLNNNFYSFQDSHILGGVISCSFITHDSQQKDTFEIQKEFNTISVSQLLNSFNGGFNILHGQPAKEICKNIIECKSVFDR